MEVVGDMQPVVEVDMDSVADTELEVMALAHGIEALAVDNEARVHNMEALVHDMEALVHDNEVMVHDMEALVLDKAMVLDKAVVHDTVEESSNLTGNHSKLPICTRDGCHCR